MSSAVIRVTNTTRNSLSLSGDEGKPRVDITSLGYIDIQVSDVDGNVLLCNTLSTWITSGTVIVTQGGVVLASDQLDTLLVPVDDVTAANTDLYVNSTTGSDESGDGSIAQPYATIVKAYNTIPHWIKHRVRLLIAAGTYTEDFPSFVGNKFSDNGSLAFIGVGVPSVVAAGPFTLTGSAAVGTNAGLKLTAAAAGFTVDAHYGKFARLLDGTRINYAYPVFANDADDIWSINFTNKPSVADTFDIVKPAVTITAQRVTFDLSNQAEMWDSSWANARIAVVNINLDFSASTATGGLLTAIGPGYLWLDFVRVVMPAGVYEPVMLVGGPTINYYLPLDSTLLASSGSSVVQIGAAEMSGFTVERVGGPPGSLGDFGIYNSSIRMLGSVCRGDIIVYESGGRFTRCAAGRLMTFVSKIICENSMFYGKAGSIGFSSHAGTTALLVYCHVLTGTSAFRSGSADLGLVGCTCEGTLTGYGLEADALSKVRITGAITLAGISGDIEWSAPTPATTSAWPAADGTSVNDGLGAVVTRSD